MNIAGASCADDSEAFRLAFSKNIHDNTKMIAEYCYDCPIRTLCLSQALADDAYGVWGGKTRPERLEMVSYMKFAGLTKRSFLTISHG